MRLSALLFTGALLPGLGLAQDTTVAVDLSLASLLNGVLNIVSGLTTA